MVVEGNTDQILPVFLTLDCPFDLINSTATASKAFPTHCPPFPSVFFLKQPTSLYLGPWLTTILSTINLIYKATLSSHTLPALSYPGSTMLH